MAPVLWSVPVAKSAVMGHVPTCSPAMLIVVRAVIAVPLRKLVTVARVFVRVVLLYATISVSTQVEATNIAALVETSARVEKRVIQGTASVHLDKLIATAVALTCAPAANIAVPVEKYVHHDKRVKTANVSSRHVQKVSLCAMVHVWM